MFVFSNLATSLDGKIASADRGLFNLGTPADRRQMQVLRKRADAVLMGASTLRAFRGPLLVRGAKRQPANIILSSKLEGIDPDWAFFRAEGVSRVLFVRADTPKARLKRFAERSEIELLDPKKPGIPTVLRRLKARGIERLLVEGGGGVMWDFVREGAIDEFHVTLTPWIIGGTRAPTLVDGEGFPSGKGQKLALARVRRLGDEIYLTYRRK